MAEYNATQRSAASDVMTVLQFEGELRRLGRFHVLPHIEDSLAVVVQRIKDNPAFTQSRVLARILTALALQRGEFRRAEASALDVKTLGLVIALLNAARAGTAGSEWADAANAADAAVNSQFSGGSIDSFSDADDTPQKTKSEQKPSANGETNPEVEKAKR
jgi:hypothetical protein